MRGSAASAGEVCIGQAASRDLRENLCEALLIVDVDAIVETEHLFVEVTVKMERLDGDICSLEISLRE